MAIKKKVEDEPKVLLGRHKGNLKIGLVGLPNVGKSTTFNFLSKSSVRAENFPFCTVEPHEARTTVPDERFTWLCQHFKPKNEVCATLSVFDIAGLVPGAHRGEGLGNAFLSHIQSVDGIYHVVRAFEDADVIHTEGRIDPVADLSTIHEELCLKDLQRCEKLHEDTQKAFNRNQKDKVKRVQLETLTAALELLKEKKWITEGTWKGQDIEFLNEISFLTAKPVLYLVNLSKKDYIRKKNKWLSKIHHWVEEHGGGPIIPYSADFEKSLTDVADSANITDKHAPQSALSKIIKTGYATLRLCHFFTSGEDEVKCWTIRQGTKAPQAAGIIHSDFERGFICAEVYKYDDLVEHKNETNLRNAGLIRQQGKNYIVEDGDVIFFKFNVTTTGKK